MDVNETLVRSLLELNQLEKEKSKKIMKELEEKIDLLQRQLSQFQLAHTQRMKVQRQQAFEYYKKQDDEKRRQDITCDCDCDEENDEVDSCG